MTRNSVEVVFHEVSWNLTGPRRCPAFGLGWGLDLQNELSALPPVIVTVGGLLENMVEVARCLFELVTQRDRKFYVHDTYQAFSGCRPEQDYSNSSSVS